MQVALVVANILLVLVTAVYVVLTWRMVGETSKMAREAHAQTMAHIHAFCWLDPHEDTGRLNVRSAGTGMVYNVHLQIDSVWHFVAGALPPGQAVAARVSIDALSVGTRAILHWGNIATGGGQNRPFELDEDGQWLPLRADQEGDAWLSLEEANQLPQG